MPITPLPPSPLDTDPTDVFEQKAIALAKALPLMTAEIDATSAVMNAKEASAVAAALNADASASMALAAANFKGDWAGLAGALNKPASARYNGRFFALLNNLANVALSTPGVSADWAVLPLGVLPTQLITVNTTAVPGVRYRLGAANVVLTLAASYAKGERNQWVNVCGAAGPVISFGAHKYHGVAIGQIDCDSPWDVGEIIYEDAAEGFH